MNGKILILAALISTPLYVASAEFKSGKWIVDSKSDPMNDAVMVRALLPSATGTYLGKPYFLWMLCKDGELQIAIDWHKYMGENPQTLVRIGDGESKIQTWRSGNDKSKTGPTNATDFAKSLLNQEQLALRVIPVSDDTITISFDISEYTQSIEPLRKECPF